MTKEMTKAQMAKRIEELEAAASAKVRIAVSKKGAVSVYGIRRFPITFYKGEWDILLGMEEEIREFIEEHDDELVNKGETIEEEEE